MPRNRYKNKHAKKESRDLEAQQSPSKKPSPVAQAVIKRIFDGGQDYLMQNAERIMLDSVSLAEEPEFSDLYMNTKERTAEVTERWLEKYESRLRAAEMKSNDAFQQEYDEVRIKIIDELATPAFRKLLNERLQMLVNRVMATSDSRKIEMALALGPMLGMKKLPWGLCGLIIAIYNRTMEQTLNEIQDNDEVLDAMLEALKEVGEEVSDPRQIFESPEKLDQVGEKLFEKNPELRDRLEKQAEEIMDSFEEAVMEGKVPLKLFTETELAIPFKRVEEEMGINIADAKPSEELTQQIGRTIIQSINDILAPERYQRLRKDLETTAKAWMRERNKWGGALQMELGWLDPDTYEENPFIISAFFGQMRSLGGDQKSGPLGKRRKH